MTEKIRTICVINGKRGGFNALLPTMRAIGKHPGLKLQVMLTDMHLAELFGKTVSDARKWVRITRTVDIAQRGDSARERTQALGRGLSEMARALAELKPDMILLLGDRSETLVAAFAALQLKIPVAHIQGGEISGNIDGIQRHAITKLAHLHFAETEDARKRIIALGEEAWRVSRVGAPYIDFIREKLYTSGRDVRKKYGLAPGEKFLLVLQHPVTTEPERAYPDMRETLAAVKSSGMRAITVYPCSDQGYQGIIDALEEKRGDKQFSIYKNIPAEDFIGLEAEATALVGNSSAGIYEAPYVACPFVSVGKRQEGRERENNVLDVVPERGKILAAIRRAASPAFRKSMRPRHIYGDGRAAGRIVRVLARVPLGPKLFEKKITF